MRFEIEIPPIGGDAVAGAVRRRWDSLTKPPGSLGQLETLLLRIALIQGTAEPRAARKGLAVFCGDHGVTAEGISACPSAVTAQMVKNFLAGGAAVSVLCRYFGITPVIVDTGVMTGPEPGVEDLRLGAGTANFVETRAMTEEQTVRALRNGRALARAWSGRFDIAAAGEMGIGNTTPATALLCAITGANPGDVAGPGAGLDRAGVGRKADCIRRALARHRDAVSSRDPMAILGALGGFEIATMCGFYLGAAEHRLPVVVDGFISTSAALVAREFAPAVTDSLLFSHASAEPGHAAMCAALGVRPPLALDMRLGEGSGAALLMPMIDASAALYSGMATFEEARVSLPGSEAARP